MPDQTPSERDANNPIDNGYVDLDVDGKGLPGIDTDHGNASGDLNAPSERAGAGEGGRAPVVVQVRRGSGERPRILRDSNRSMR